MLKLVKIIFFVLAISSMAIADQAEVVSLETAKEAKKILIEKGQMLEFCEPCNDQQCLLTKVDNIHISSPQADSYTVKVNGKAIDLAYVFFNDNGSWQNLALHLGLQVENVSTILDVAKCNANTPAQVEVSGEQKKCIYPDCDSKEWSMSSFSKDFFYNTNATILTMKNNSRYIGIWVASQENDEFKKDYWQVDCISRSFGDEWYNVKPAVPGTVAMGLVKDICNAFPVKQAVTKKKKK